MTMTTICLQNKNGIGKEKAPDLYLALDALVTGSTEYILFDGVPEKCSEAKPPCVGLIPWFSLRDRAFTAELCDLWRKGCRRFVLVAPTLLTPDLPPPWSRLPAHLRTAFNEAVAVCEKASWEELKAAIVKAGKAEPWATCRVQEHAEAWMLYEDVLSKYSHNSKADLSNQFLAPARLLALLDPARSSSSRDDWRKVWKGNGADKGFEKEISDSVKGDHGSLGEELRIAVSRITNGFPNGSKLLATDLENLMALLTEIRVSAGVRTQSAGSAGTKPVVRIQPICAKNGTDPFRVLVVDDHAASWSPVFERLQEKLLNRKQASLKVSFEFSLDGETVKQSKATKEDRVHFSYYDLVILDVFLGGTTGIEILELLRRDFSQLPVLLWTTSRDEEITAEATLANGILLKKTVTWESLTGAVARWVERGKAMRTTTLPNPFFNHTITNLKYRQLAVDFHEWCLKQLDSFHALDGEYFRYFTDHGGRHIVKLWELMEQALQPFLQDDEQTVLPKDPNQRELEILGLYLTVICHELGMFPMRIGDKVEDFSKLGTGYLDDVRSLHAVRGMVLLHDSKPSPDGKRIGQYWNDNRGRELGAMLRAKGLQELADRLAVLVGYHARVFKSLGKGEFLEWEKSKKGLDAKFKKLASPVPSLSRTDDAFRSTYLALEDVFKDTAIRERLRRQCALFRFVDALDITASRNPAEFLVGSGTLPAKQYGENLKRELCRSAKIENGDVRVEMAVQAPTFEMVKAIIKYVEEKQLMEKDDRKKAKKAWSFFKDEHAARTRVEKPWDLPDANGWQIHALKEESVMCLQKPLDCWLKEVWRLLIDKKGSTELIKQLKKLKILDAKAQEPKLRFEGAEMIASVTALSVAGELLDEYQAIVEAELSDKIRFPDSKSKSGFRWGSAWVKRELPDGLSTLERVLPPRE